MNNLQMETFLQTSALSHVFNSHLQEDIAKNKDEKRGVGEAKIIVSRSHPGPVKTNLEVLPLFCFPL